MKTAELLFVYNADSDIFSTVSDFAHKLISPSTYQCHLCALTYGNFTEKKDWKSFIENFPAKVSFLHKDEFEKKFQVNSPLPAVFLRSESALHSFISRQDIYNCKTLDDLKQLVENKYHSYVQHHHSNIQ
jgi:hypothetical protein